MVRKSTIGYRRKERTFKLIDTDKDSFLLVKIETKKGCGYRVHRVVETGNYTKICNSVNLLMTVEAGNSNLAPHSCGLVQNPRKWWKITAGGPQIKMYFLNT